MYWLLVTCGLLPLVAGQSIAPAFRPDTVTTVTGQVWCGNSPVGFVTVEWWQDRGQQIDTLLGSSRTDASGRFQVNSRQPAPSNTYLFIRSNCNGNNQASRTDVSLLSPFNIQVQLRRGSGNNNPSQVSGMVFCGNQPAVWQSVEWFVDRGNQIDLPLGSSQTDGRGFFIISGNQNRGSNSYLILRNNCNGRQQTARVTVNNINSMNMRIQLRTGDRFPRGISGQRNPSDDGTSAAEDYVYSDDIWPTELAEDQLNPINPADNLVN